MPRIDYAHPSPELAEAIMERRGGLLTPLDLLLAHNGGLILGWNALVGAVRTQFALPGDLREMVILRIGVLNDAPYEWDSHIEVARQEGLPDALIEKLRNAEPFTGSSKLDDVLRFVDESTREVRVSAETFDALRRHFDDRSIAELTAVIAVYNMVSRFLVALNVRTSDREILAATFPEERYA